MSNYLEIYKTFDFPEPTQIKGERDVTTVPSQALFFLNSPLAQETARACAQRLLDDAGIPSDEVRVSRAFTLLYGRHVTEVELRETCAYLASMAAEPAIWRWTSLVQALMGSTEFRYLW